MNYRSTLKSSKSQSDKLRPISKCDCADSDALALTLKALAHPSRLEIVRQLAKRDRCCGADFCACLPLSQSTISQHLELLKKAGLVEWHQQGTKSIFTLNRGSVEALVIQLGNLIDPSVQKAEE